MNLEKVFSWLLCCLFCLCFSSKALAAEVLQVSSHNILQVGDHNRIYTVKIACFEVNPSKQEQARSFLKSQYKRRRKVNLRPVSSEEGVLVAGIIPIDSRKEIGEEMIEKGFGNSTC